MNQQYIKEEHQIFRASLQKFLKQEAEPYFETWENQKTIPRSFWKKLGEQGFLCPWAEEIYGGLEADFPYSVISSFQNTQFKMAEMATEIKIGRTFVDQLIEKHIERADIVTEVSMAKWWITDLAKKVSVECMQVHGGYGYMEEYEIARRFRDTAVTSIYAGSNEIMKGIIAKNLNL
ncbi:acyl-CoA dehydrogenase family protein [Alteribacillus bidgolensis]|uniref:Acyl-CoA dehydrogenase, N-terminal domain n=1 Tax=Alteribacillus bidgolensis TaxID=930129 RepID=A0A1G8D1K0_9BACI|nr:acyl-CoA dehydrogenase family protein [Alteribacillus bidgolensis]SDH51393.1 Acyl-CoA dehydrogenase, N-terminal domain [Alteribacillus bidgolensis]